ncbi:MAG: ABC transporter ATP-binding protein [Longimicrobiales bacterium]|nr:ABC transporter ATP-binding protein [Longimicrobiales bacterium]
MNRVVMTGFAVAYPGFTLGPLDLALAAGERVALVGPNGAGKSTALKGMVGLLPEYRGSVRFQGAEVGEDAPGVRSRVGVLPEKLLGFGWMSVQEHLDFLAEFHPTWDRDYAADLTRRVDLPPATKLANLSKGMSVKLSLVAAEAYRPPLLLLDEPTSGLDPVMRTEVLDLINECAPRDGDRTVLFSSHILEDIEAVADRVLILRDGRLIEDAEVGDLRERHPGVPLSRVILEKLTHA